MSRALSVARVAFESANIALEDLLLGELAGKKVSSADFVQKVGASLGALCLLEEKIGALKSRMDSYSYADLPSLKTVDASRTAILEAGLVSARCWDLMRNVMQNSTFFGVLSYHTGRVSLLKERTSDLLQKVEALPEFPAGAVLKMLESNEHGNFKAEFARLYSLWNTFQDEFLASSLVSTEVWYLHNGTGSLAATATPLRSVA